MMEWIFLAGYIIVWYLFVKAFLAHVATTQLAYTVPTLQAVFGVLAVGFLIVCLITLFRLKRVYRKLDREYQNRKK